MEFLESKVCFNNFLIYNALFHASKIAAKHIGVQFGVCPLLVEFSQNKPYNNITASDWQ